MQSFAAQVELDLVDLLEDDLRPKRPGTTPGASADGRP